MVASCEGLLVVVDHGMRQFSICIDTLLWCIADFNSATTTMVSSYVFGYAYMLVEATAIVFTYILVAAWIRSVVWMEVPLFRIGFLQQNWFSAIGSKGGMKIRYVTVCTDVLMLLTIVTLLCFGAW